MREFLEHDILFNEWFLAGLKVLGLQYKSQVFAERGEGERERERGGRRREWKKKSSVNEAKSELNIYHFFPFQSLFLKKVILTLMLMITKFHTNTTLWKPDDSTSKPVQSKGLKQQIISPATGLSTFCKQSTPKINTQIQRKLQITREASCSIPRRSAAWVKIDKCPISCLKIHFHSPSSSIMSEKRNSISEPPHLPSHQEPHGQGYSWNPGCVL